MPKRPNLARLIELQHFLLSFRAIDRTLHIPPGLEKLENDVEHSYALAMTAWFLAPHFPHLDRDTLLRFALAHDLVEVYAGDTYAYTKAKDAFRQKAEREHQAQLQLQKHWADFPDLIATIKAYEARNTSEAKFIYALDKLMPALMDYINEGRGWHHHGITFANFVAEKNKKIPLSPEINEYSQALIKTLDKQQHLFPKP